MKPTKEEKEQANKTLESVKKSIKRDENIKLKRNLVMVDTEYDTHIAVLKGATKMDRLPEQAIVHYGCLSCEWKGTQQCPFGFKSGTGRSNLKNCHSRGICKFRTAWLMSLYQGKLERPSYKKWLRDYHKAVGNEQYKIDERMLRQIDEKIAALKEKGGDSKEISKYEVARQTAYLNMTNLWRTIRYLDEKAEDREATKKIKVDMSQSDTIPLSEIHRIMRLGKKEVVVDENGKIKNS